MSGHIVAPWFAGDGFLPEADPEILEKTLTLSETASSGPAALTCAAATGVVETAPVVGLFNGKVTDAAMAASTLGVAGDSVAVLKQTCTASGGAVQIYHLVKQDRLLMQAGEWSISSTVRRLIFPRSQRRPPPLPLRRHRRNNAHEQLLTTR